MIARLRLDRGAAAVEAAFLVALVLVPLVIGAVEFGFAFADWQSVSSAAREGARVGSAAGDEALADCTILEATAGALTAIDNDRVQEVWIYESDAIGSVGAKQRYRPALPTDNPASLVCTTWFPVETGWPAAGRDDDGDSRDWLGVKIVFDHEWVTGAMWFSGSVRWQDDTVMRLEPELET